MKIILTACLSWSCQQDTSTPVIKSLESKSSIVKMIQNATLKWACKRKPWIINEVRSDDFWTGKISKNILMYQTIRIIKLKNTRTGV